MSALERARAALAEVEWLARYHSLNRFRRFLCGPRADMIDGLTDPGLLAPERAKLHAVLRRILEEKPRGALARAIVVAMDEGAILLRLLHGRLARSDFGFVASAYLWLAALGGLGLALANTADAGHVREPVAVDWRAPDGSVERQVLRSGEAVVYRRGRGGVILRRWKPAQGYDYAETSLDESR